MKKILSTLLALCMLCALFPAGALGEEAPLEPDFELEELLPEELIPEPLPDEAIPDQPAPEPLREDLPDLPDDLIEVPLLQTMEEAERYESNVSGTVYASSLKSNDAITLTGDTILVMDTDKTLKSIKGKSYNLTVQGSGTLTVNNPDGHGIDVCSFTGSAPMVIVADDAGIVAEFDITLSSYVTVQSGGYSLDSHSGTIRIIGGTILTKNTGKNPDNPHAMISWNNIEFLGGTVIADAPDSAIEARKGITLKTPVSVMSPEYGRPDTFMIGPYQWWAILDAGGKRASHVEIGIPSLVREYVKRCYQVILSREGEPQGVEYWTNALQAHQAEGADIIAQFCSSKEFNGMMLMGNEILWKLYEAMMGREPDDEGLAYWLPIMDNLVYCGCSCNRVINGFSTSAEFKQICDSYGIIPGTVEDEMRDLNPQVTRFVNRCYLQTLERSGDPDGLNYWAGQLLNRTQTAQQVALSFLSSPEFKNRDLSNKDYVTVLYWLYMGHAPEESGFEYWVGLLDSGTPRETIAATFGTTPEFTAIVSSYGL